MAEHLHGYPRCETPVGTSCGSTDLHFEECKNHGALRSCEASVVDGIPTGQYRCAHDEAPAKAAKAKKAGGAKPKAKPKKAARKAKGKKKAARKPAKASRRPSKAKAKARGGRAKKGGARKKK
jgi:hypothetical protein